MFLRLVMLNSTADGGTTLSVSAGAAAARAKIVSAGAKRCKFTGRFLECLTDSLRPIRPGVPDADRAADAGRRQAGAGRAARDAGDRPAVFPPQPLPAGRQVPEPHRPVESAAGQPPAVRAERYRVDVVAVPAERE